MEGNASQKLCLHKSCNKKYVHSTIFLQVFSLIRFWIFSEIKTFQKSEKIWTHFISSKSTILQKEKISAFYNAEIFSFLLCNAWMLELSFVGADCRKEKKALRSVHNGFKTF